ncbi:MAG: glycogen/starch synthase [Candidatus Wallbacteria bacterium]|nr:glycogen/starch synthase [Candidatus Wallbacteria bacterium]
MEKTRVLYAVSEASPFAKTGGLADVAAALPAGLVKAGVDCRVIMPKYKSVYDSRVKTKKLGDFSVNLAGNVLTGELEEAKFPGSRVVVYFIRCDQFYYRDGLYQCSGRDYEDNAGRFAFFCRGVLESLKIIRFKPDILHCNDWQTALIPCYLKSGLYKNDAVYRDIRTVFTIHNLSFQGVFWHLDMPLLGLGWEYFTQDKLEFYGKISFIKAGIIYADKSQIYSLGCHICLLN